MSGINVSDSGTNYYYGNLVSSLNSKLQNISEQVSTGKVAQIYGDLGAKTGTSLSLHAQNAALSAYSSAIKNVSIKTDQMDQAMSSMTKAIQKVLADINKISQGGTPDLTLLKTDAQDAIQDIMSRLNSSVNGQFIFGGNQSNKAPIADTTAATTNITTIVAAYSTGTSAASIISSLDGLTDAQLGFDTGLAGAGKNTFRADENRTLDYTVKANEGQFKKALTGLAQIANLSYDSANASSFWTLFNDAKSRLNAANTDTSSRQGQLGIVRNQMKSLIDTQSDTQLTLQNNISDIEDADTAALSTTLSTLQTQIQSTYSIIGKISQLSLTKYV